MTEGVGGQTIPPKRRHTVLEVAVCALILVVLAECLGFPSQPLVVAFYLTVGWMSYLGRLLPSIRVSLPGLTTAAACAAGVVLVGHATARWIYGGVAKTEGGRWKWWWTFGAVTSVVLVFVAGIATVGMAHQTAWLATSRVPMFTSRHSANSVRCAVNLRSIGLALNEYARGHGGHYPERLEELLAVEGVPPEVFVCPADWRSTQGVAGGPNTAQAAERLRLARGSYVLLTPRMIPPADRGLASVLPVVCEPLANHDGERMNVLFADGHVESVDAVDAVRVLAIRPTTRPP
jgi:prepilin-type processing-associated H-X9-DG protein